LGKWRRVRRNTKKIFLICTWLCGINASIKKRIEKKADNAKNSKDS
jgi:hypothetical protein